MLFTRLFTRLLSHSRHAVENDDCITQVIALNEALKNGRDGEEEEEGEEEEKKLK